MPPAPELIFKKAFLESWAPPKRVRVSISSIFVCKKEIFWFSSAAKEASSWPNSKRVSASSNFPRTVLASCKMAAISAFSFWICEALRLSNQKSGSASRAWISPTLRSFVSRSKRPPEGLYFGSLVLEDFFGFSEGKLLHRNHPNGNRQLGQVPFSNFQKKVPFLDRLPFREEVPLGKVASIGDAPGPPLTFPSG